MAGSLVQAGRREERRAQRAVGSGGRGATMAATSSASQRCRRKEQLLGRSSRRSGRPTVRRRAYPANWRAAAGGRANGRGSRSNDGEGHAARRRQSPAEVVMVVVAADV